MAPYHCPGTHLPTRSGRPVVNSPGGPPKCKPRGWEGKLRCAPRPAPECARLADVTPGEFKSPKLQGEPGQFQCRLAHGSHPPGMRP